MAYKTKAERIAEQRQAQAIQHIRANLAATLESFSENIIEVPEAERWRYAIPANYTNYQDGFLEQDGEFYRGRPMLDYNGEILYFWRSIDWLDRSADENEKLLLFDRHNKRYTFIVRSAPEPLKDNPSYWEFIKRVKRYKPSLKTRLDQAKRQHVAGQA